MMQRRTIRFVFYAILAMALMMVVTPGVYGQGGTPTATPTTTPPAAGTTTTAQQTTHVVQPGENLFRISLRYGVTVRSIADANGIANPNLIYVGQVLTIPGGTTGQPPGPQTPPTPTPPPTTPPTGTQQYTVAAGDTLSKIARQFNTSTQAIAQANGITNVNLIYVGQVLNITAGTGAPPPTTDGGTTTPQPGGGTAFELGGHVANFNNVNEMRTARMTWAKVQIRYSLGENTDEAAQAINDAHLNGFKILLSIVGDRGEISSTGLNNYITQFSTYLGNVASLGPEAIEVWNEPNLDKEWPAGQINPASYTEMLRAAYQAIKAKNNAVMVISAAPSPTGFYGGCTANGCDDAPFVRGMAQAGAAQYMDCIGVHYNEGVVGPTQSSGDPRGNPNHYTRYFPTMLNTYYNAFGGAKPVCWTELGYVTMEGLGAAAPAGFDWAANNTLQEQTTWLQEATQLSRNSGRVRLLIVWNVNFTGASPDPAGGYAIIRPGGACPACSALAQAMQ